MSTSTTKSIDLNGHEEEGKPTAGGPPAPAGQTPSPVPGGPQKPTTPAGLPPGPTMQRAAVSPRVDDPSPSGDVKLGGKEDKPSDGPPAAGTYANAVNMPLNLHPARTVPPKMTQAVDTPSGATQQVVVHVPVDPETPPEPPLEHPEETHMHPGHALLIATAEAVAATAPRAHSDRVKAALQALHKHDAGERDGDKHRPQAQGRAGQTADDAGDADDGDTEEVKNKKAKDRKDREDSKGKDGKDSKDSKDSK